MQKLINELSDLLYQMSAVATNREEAQEINELAMKGQDILLALLKTTE